MKNLLIITLCFLVSACNPYRGIEAIADGRERDFEVAIDERYTIKRGRELLFIESICITAKNRRIPAELAALEVRYKVRQFFKPRRLKIDSGLAMDAAAIEAIHKLCASKFPDLDVEVNWLLVRHQRSGVKLYVNEIMKRITEIKSTPYIDLRTGRYREVHERVLKELK